MSREDLKIEGIVVKALDYEEHKRIFVLFTETGFLHLITKLKNQQPHRRLLSSVLSKGEFCYKDSTSSLKTILDGTLVSTYLNYSQSYAHLEAASLHIEVVLRSQLEDKPAPLLYKLLSFHLEKLKQFEDPYLLSSSFMLKALAHEALFNYFSLCPECHQNPAHYFDQYHLVCQDCAKHPSLMFDSSEHLFLCILLNAKHLSELQKMKCSLEFHKKVKKMFDLIAG